MAIGAGGLDLGLYATQDLAGARAAYVHKVNRVWSLFGAGSVEMDLAKKLSWEVTGGVRGQW